MSLLDALAIEPFSVNEPLIDALLLEPDMEEFYLVNAGDAGEGDGTIGDPHQVPDAVAFDALMNSYSAQTNITFHLGPGDFLTNGFGNGIGWKPKTGWRFVGTGMDVTTLKLSGSFTAHQEYFVIGGSDTDVADGFEIHDLTLDANLPSIPTSVAAGGIKVFGSGIRIHDIRVINFGTRSNLVPGRAVVTAGAYPGNPEPFDCVVEDCEIDLPFSNSVREIHCTVLAGGEGAADGFMVYHRGCVVRNCYIDCHYSNSESAVSRIEVINDSTRLARVTTKVAHGYATGAWVKIFGALEASAFSTRFNGSFQITNATTTQFDITYPTSGAVDPTGDMYANRVPSRRVPIATLTRNGDEWTLTTTTPHYRSPNDIVVLNNVKEGGNPSLIFNQRFLVTAVLSPYQLTFDLTSSATPQVGEAWIGVDFYGVTTAGGRGVIVEGNRIHSVTFGHYHDRFSSIDVIIRDNHFLGVLAAVYGKLGSVSGPRAGQSLNAAGTIAEFTTVDAHGLAKGDPVVISDASIAAYNGVFKIDSVTSPKKFKYTTLTSPAGSPTGMKFGALWRIGRWIIENNTVDLVGTVIATVDPPTAIRLERTASVPGAPTSPYVFGQVVINANIVRMIENAFDTSTTPLGIALNNCEQAIIEDNVISLARLTPVEFIACGAIKFFNNQSPSGKLLQGYDLTNSRLMNELETDVDLAAVSVM